MPHTCKCYVNSFYTVSFRDQLSGTLGGDIFHLRLIESKDAEPVDTEGWVIIVNQRLPYVRVLNVFPSVPPNPHSTLFCPGEADLCGSWSPGLPVTSVGWHCPMGSTTGRQKREGSELRYVFQDPVAASLVLLMPSLPLSYSTALSLVPVTASSPNPLDLGC